jgi:hypothetical protein
MSNATTADSGLTAGDWVSFARSEYLAGPVASGGSAIRFVSGSDATLAAASDRLAQAAAQCGFESVQLDPGMRDEDGKAPNLHRIDRFFTAVTRDAEWKAWAEAEARCFLEQQTGVTIPADVSLRDVDAVARTTGMDANRLLLVYERELTRRISDHRLTLEFRAALAYLFSSALRRDEGSPTTDEVLLAWLRGKSLPGGAAALKRLQIYGRIGPLNARHYLASYCHWLRKRGKAGLLVVFDFRPYIQRRITALERNAALDRRLRSAAEGGAGLTAAQLADMLHQRDEAAPTIAYADGAYYQMLASLRRFIDEIDRFPGLFMVVLTSPSFYSPSERGRRTFNDYDALQTRIGLDVADAERPNPAAALVHLGRDEQ